MCYTYLFDVTDVVRPGRRGVPVPPEYWENDQDTPVEDRKVKLIRDFEKSVWFERGWTFAGIACTQTAGLLRSCMELHW